jgi:hypothetical protein
LRFGHWLELVTWQKEDESAWEARAPMEAAHVTVTKTPDAGKRHPLRKIR